MHSITYLGRLLLLPSFSFNARKQTNNRARPGAHANFFHFIDFLLFVRARVHTFTPRYPLPCHFLPSIQTHTVSVCSESLSLALLVCLPYFEILIKLMLIVDGVWYTDAANRRAAIQTIFSAMRENDENWFLCWFVFCVIHFFSRKRTNIIAKGRQRDRVKNQLIKHSSTLDLA